MILNIIIDLMKYTLMFLRNNDEYVIILRRYMHDSYSSNSNNAIVLITYCKYQKKNENAETRFGGSCITSPL